MFKHKFVWIIAGPTASGKSRLALDLAASCGGEILNADSIQVYRDLRILSARPSPEDEERIPHRGYGFLGPLETFSAGAWLKWAIDEIIQIRKRGKIPLVTGGTGLYLKALTSGLPNTPAVPPEIRARLREELASSGLHTLYAKLKKNDPAGASLLSPTDGQRIIRSLEVLEFTGKSLSFWQSNMSLSCPFPVRTILLAPERALLAEKANQRIHEMFTSGAIEEVKNLVDQNVPHTAPIFRALGSVPLYRYLTGEIKLENAIMETQIQTRQYIKRQFTWFRHQIKDTPINTTGENTAVLQQIIQESEE